jgi:hypothetical protein
VGKKYQDAILWWEFEISVEFALTSKRFSIS